ncbi:equilibrative nucleoside transporter 2-like isoform X3 [Phyllopteryx taeniolatus]|uniref:equilibrative nucleoside transporter 2-like isoform X3 n=1 Tax=Phyllopteryx taeniolatus TaxID=161469 RepID=UPI002AD3F0C6|nr:equilibrative nucleoside transporter 2-like isoform X3 [Phyllopteryx taeniolatus]
MPEEKKASAPADRGNMVAAIIFMLGLGTLLPWNFFITASQYFNQRLKTSGETVKEYNYDSWMVLLSQLPLLLFTLLNSFFYQWVWEGVRVATSLVAILLLFSLTAALVEVHMTPDTFFSVTMATIWFINSQSSTHNKYVFSAVLQGSLFGAVGLLPARYSTLFMTGQGLAGIFAAVAMLCSVLGNADTKSAALGYFITPCVATLGTLTCYMILPHLEFARFYLRRRSNDVDEEAKMKELLPSADGHVVSSKDGKHLEADRRLMGEPLERSSVLLVFKKIWPMALCITCVFAVTLSVFPVVTVRVETVYKKHTDWAVQGQLCVPVRRCVACALYSIADDVQHSWFEAERLPVSPRRRLRRHHGALRLLQRVPGQPLHGLRAAACGPARLRDGRLAHDLLPGSGFGAWCCAIFPAGKAALVVNNTHAGNQIRLGKLFNHLKSILPRIGVLFPVKGSDYT